MRTKAPQLYFAKNFLHFILIYFQLALNPLSCKGPDRMPLHNTLKDLIEKSDLTVSLLSRRAKIPPHRVYEMIKKDVNLRTSDAEALYKVLTGKDLLPDE